MNVSKRFGLRLFPCNRWNRSSSIWKKGFYEGKLLLYRIPNWQNLVYEDKRKASFVSSLVETMTRRYSEQENMYIPSGRFPISFQRIDVNGTSRNWDFKSVVFLISVGCFPSQKITSWARYTSEKGESVLFAKLTNSTRRYNFHQISLIHRLSFFTLSF